MARRAVLVSSLLLCLAACSEGGVQGSAADVAFSVPVLDVGTPWEGDSAEASVTLTNRGRAPATLRWDVPQGSFSFGELPEKLPGASEILIRVRFTSEDDGPHRATLTVHNDAESESVELVANVRAIPACPTPVACHTVVFDKKLGQCVETPMADGTQCDPHSACVTGGTCQAGRCTGTPIVCDDGNACTLDTCNVFTGCEFPPAPPCPGDGLCKVGVCNPKTGCGLQDAVDGSRCGPGTCDAAQVCMSGACVTADPPDGYVCAEASPCQGEGICQGSACVRDPATTLAPSWSLDSALPESPQFLHDFVLEPSTGELSLLGFFSKPMVRANGNAYELPASARRCILWNAQLACADYRENGADGEVSLIDPSNGQTRWTFNLAKARPDIDLETKNLFMARVTSLGSDRLAALFESYPQDGSSQPTNCRGYYLVVLDSAGTMISAQRLVDPVLQKCDHPHPFGVASDPQGNLYMTFSPTAGNAPLAPGSPTLLISFTRDGFLRWKRSEGFAGGELGVAQGLVYPENAYVPYDANTGQPLPITPQRTQRMGRVVVTDTHYVTSPIVSPFLAGGEIKAFKTDGSPAWTFSLPPEDAFLTHELRAILWQSKPIRPVDTAVLSFARRNGLDSVIAIRTRDGSELWSCPIDAPISSAPQLFEVANGSFAVMGGAMTCGDCDPPFANSSASFWTFSAPGMLPADVPWPGTFGGPGHDHLENGLGVITPSQPSN